MSSSGQQASGYVDLLRRIMADPPRLWALIIGINEYAHPSEDLKRLKGAVPDANAVDEYLRKYLQVPPGQIVNLRDEDATREGIIAAIKGLRDNPKIRKDDPILIYYAGHGSEILSNGKTVQTLIPVDYLTGKTNPIPDRTVASLLNDISKKHGNNVTVILDCCHSGSGTRGSEVAETLERRCEICPSDVPDDLDADEAESSARGMGFAEGFAVEGITSHVLLAACSANERALEDRNSAEPHGRFTAALLRLFKEVPPDQMTYVDVLTRISRIDGQNPQCEGYYKERAIFNAKVHPPTRRCYTVNPMLGTAPKFQCILEAGRAHGVTHGAQFTLYRNQAAVKDGDPLWVMEAKDDNIKAFKSILEPVGDALQLANSAIAIQTKAGVAEDLLIHVPLDNQYTAVFEAVAQVSGSKHNPCRIRLVDRDKAALEIVPSQEDGRFNFNCMDLRAKQHKFSRIPHSVKDSDVDQLHQVLRAAAHYNFQLNVNHPNNQIRDKITIDFFPLKVVGYDESIREVRSPVEGVNMHQGGRIEFFTDKHEIYGMRISNKSPWDLHFLCFYFDHADFSITAITEMDVETRYKQDYHLEKNSEVGIGYGDLGVPPLQCDVPKGLDVTIGFLKFYFTNTEEVIDLSHVPQSSPFVETRTLKPAEEVRRKDEPPVWGTILIPVIQKRRK
ncbi:hypothetical protein MD484_g4548, partial [Candolleomyces efflorescens]